MFRARLACETVQSLAEGSVCVFASVPGRRADFTYRYARPYLQYDCWHRVQRCYESCETVRRLAEASVCMPLTDRRAVLS